MALFKLDFCHNHSLHSAHSLSFQPISDSTKERIFTLFSKGHSAASARHALETELVLECSEHDRDTQRVLADRSANPTVQDYSRLYILNGESLKWVRRMVHLCLPNLKEKINRELQYNM